MTFALSAGEKRMFEPADLARAQGATAPPCASLVWTGAWRATDPLAAAWYHQIARSEIGKGRWGTVDIGCAGFELRNEGGTSVFGELVYTIGSR